MTYSAIRDARRRVLLSAWTHVALLAAAIATLVVVIYLSIHEWRHFWQAMTAVSTVWAVFVALDQLSALNRTSRADFIRRFADEFFTESTRDLMMLVDKGALTLKDDGLFPYFEIDKEKVSRFGIDEKKRGELCARERYSSYEVDDLLLGHLQDIGLFWTRGLIDMKDVCSYFYWYIHTTWENPEIRGYVRLQGKQEWRGAYRELEIVAKELELYVRRHKLRRDP